MLDVEFDKATNVRPSVAVEFDTQYVRVMQFRDHDSNNYRLRSFSEVKLPEGTIRDGVIVDIEAAAKALQKALESAKPRQPSSSYAICILPQDKTFFLTTTLPAISKQELLGIITRRVEDIFPMPEGEIYWDWHRLSTDNNKTLVQLAAVPRAVIDSYLKTLLQVKLSPLLFEPSALAAARMVASVDAKTAEACILLEVSPTGYAVSMVKQKEVVFSTVMTLPTLSPKENIKILIRKVSEIIRYSLGDEYNVETTPILIYGETEYIDIVLEQLITEKITGAINLNYNIKGTDTDHHLYHRNKEAYIPLIGAAMKGMATGKQNMTMLNLVPKIAKDAFRLKELSRMMRNYLAFIAVNVSLLIILVVVASVGIAREAEEQRERYQAVVNFSKSQKAKEIENAINELNEISTQTRKMIASIYDWQKVYSLLKEVTPAGITVSNLAAIPNLQSPSPTELDFIISGIATDRSSIISMVEHLRQSKLLKDVKLPVESLEDYRNVNFVIEAKLPFSSLLSE